MDEFADYIYNNDRFKEWLFPGDRWVRHLGEGAFGVVMLVESHGEEYAVKFTKIMDGEMDANLREIHFQKICAQSCIAPSIDVMYIEDDIMTSRMGVVDSTLAQLLSYPEVLQDYNIGKRVGEGIKNILSKLDDLHIIHGDLHRGNIGITKDVNGNMTIKLIDFGYSTYTDETSFVDEVKLFHSMRHIRGTEFFRGFASHFEPILPDYDFEEFNSIYLDEYYLPVVHAGKQVPHPDFERIRRVWSLTSKKQFLTI